MTRPTPRSRPLTGALAAFWMMLVSTAAAAPPPEVTNVRFIETDRIWWNGTPGAQSWVVYEGPLSWLASGVLLDCGADEVGDVGYTTGTPPQAGSGVFYLVTGKGLDGEGTAGADSSGHERHMGASCESVARRRTLGRLAYGWDEWTRERFAALGPQGFLEEQLDPASIDESTNNELTARKADLEPPETKLELRALDLVNAVYARRQLAHRLALFWSNHFNTDYSESRSFFGRQYPGDQARRNLEAVSLHYLELERFRDRALNGNFREILEDSALSPAMILFLDTDNNVDGRPNENYARELLELHTMGVDGGYTHHEIDAVARVMTGWNVCKKAPQDLGSFTGPCIDNSLIGTVEEPAGEWVANFRADRHDCAAKTLFENSPYEVLIPDSCANLPNGVNDLFLTLDALASHPSTTRFIATKLLQYFLTETPTVTVVDEVVATWDDSGNPHGVGDLLEVVRSVVTRAEFLDIESIPTTTTIKTPFEHLASALRAVRGKTSGKGKANNYLVRLGYILHENPIPTGYPETGDAWLDTSGILERQNFGVDLCSRTGNAFGTDLLDLLDDNGVDRSSGNAEAIVDFFGDALFGGAIGSAERAAAIDYLNTDDNRIPDPYNNARIREVVGFMLGYPQFMRQ